MGNECPVAMDMPQSKRNENQNFAGQERHQKVVNRLRRVSNLIRRGSVRESLQKNRQPITGKRHSPVSDLSGGCGITRTQHTAASVTSRQSLRFAWASRACAVLVGDLRGDLEALFSQASRGHRWRVRSYCFVEIYAPLQLPCS
jgi:hypothetical protein